MHPVVGGLARQNKYKRSATCPSQVQIASTSLAFRHQPSSRTRNRKDYLLPYLTHSIVSQKTQSTRTIIECLRSTESKLAPSATASWVSIAQLLQLGLSSRLTWVNLGLTWRASPPSDEQAFEAMHAAIESGANFWNGGEFYVGHRAGPGVGGLLTCGILGTTGSQLGHPS